MLTEQIQIILKTIKPDDAKPLPQLPEVSVKDAIAMVEDAVEEEEPYTVEEAAEAAEEERVIRSIYNSSEKKMCTLPKAITTAFNISLKNYVSKHNLLERHRKKQQRRASLKKKQPATLQEHWKEILDQVQKKYPDEQLQNAVTKLQKVSLDKTDSADTMYKFLRTEISQAKMNCCRSIKSRSSFFTTTNSRNDATLSLQCEEN